MRRRHRQLCAIHEAPIEGDDVVVKVEVVGGSARAIVGVDHSPKEVDRLVDRVDALIRLQLRPQCVENLVWSGRSSRLTGEKASNPSTFLRTMMPSDLSDRRLTDRQSGRGHSSNTAGASRLMRCVAPGSHLIRFNRRPRPLSREAIVGAFADLIQQIVAARCNPTPVTLVPTRSRRRIKPPL